MFLIDLLYNLSALIAISVLSGFIDLRYSSDKLIAKILQGILFGFAAVVGMLYPFVLTEGIIFDGRSIVVSLAAFFFGPLSGIIAAVMGILYRVFYVGGSGALTGVFVILNSYLVGIVFYFLFRHHKKASISLWQFFLLGFIVHVGMLLLLFTLPSSFQKEAFQLISLTVIGVFPLVTVLIGKILLDHEINRNLLKSVSQSEKLFRTTLYSIGDAVITTNKDGLVMQMNKIAEDLCGYTENEAAGKPLTHVFNIISETDRKTIKNPVDVVLTAKKIVGLANHTLLVHKNGQEIPIADSGAPIVDVDGKIIGVVLVFRDQREERALNLELLRSAESFRSLFDSITNAIYVQDEQGRFLDVNEGAVQMYGYPKEAFIGQTPDFLSAEGKNDIAVVQTAIQKTFEGTPQQFEFWGKRSDGSIFPKEVNLFKTTYFGQNAIIAIAQDITTRKKTEKLLRESEEQYRMLITHQTDLVVRVEAETVLTYVSPSYCKMFEKTEAELLGNSFMPLIYEEDRENTSKALEALDYPPHTAYMEQRVQTPSGMRWLAWSDKAIVDEKGVIQSVIGVGRDITEQKVAEIEREESEKRYRLLFDASPVGVLLEDSKGTILQVNDTFCRDYGYEADELIGKNIDMLVPEANRVVVQDNIRQIIEKQILHSIVKSKTKSGNDKISELIERRITLPNGEIGILSISKDITEQELAKMKLRETQERNAAIIAVIPDFMFAFDEKGTFLDYVAPDKASLYLPENSFLNKPVEDVLPPYLAALTMKNIKIALESGELIQYEYALYEGKDQKWFDARMVKSGENKVLVIVRDISSRRKQDDELFHQKRFIETLLDSVPNPLFYMDKNGQYLGVNKSFTDYYGLTTADVIGKKVFDFEDETIAREQSESDQLIFSGIEKRQVFERVLHLPNGTVRDAIITKSPFPDLDNKTVGGLIGIIVDITDRKKMEQELISAKEKAEESDRLKTSFLNNLSHEIRTPMNAIIGFSDLLLNESARDQQRVFVETINNNAEQLLRIIDDVLAVSRLDSEKIPLEAVPFSIAQLLDDLLLTFKQACEQKNLKIKLHDIPPSVPTIIVADKSKLRQVLSGLLGNALKYTFKGEITIGVQLQGDQLSFYVNDTGIGISSADQPKIFDRFFRSDEAQIRAIRGNGLGLSISKGLVDLLKGTIEVQSEPQKGSSFRVNIPFQTSEKQFQKPEYKAMPGKTGKKLTILFAEDEEDNSLIIEWILKDHYTLIATKNGHEAFQMAVKHPIDLVLMDIKMPIMNGIEAARKILDQKPYLPIIALTAYTQPEEVKQCMEAGCIDYLSKPLDSSKLLMLIKKHLN